MGFKQDLQIGQKAQEYIVKQLSKEFKGIKSVPGLCSDCDLIADNGYTIEVKFDLKSKLTNNIGIEYRYKGKPSGIAKTKSQEWVHIYYLNGWVYSRIKVNDLKAYLKSNWGYLPKLKGGDNNNSKMVIVKSEDFANRFGFMPILSRQDS